jgi:hypothetical protein
MKLAQNLAQSAINPLALSHLLYRIKVMGQWLSLLVGSLLTLAAGAIGTVLTTNLALRRFYRERWWERKAEAYSRIIEALHHAAHCMSEWSDVELTGQMLSDDKAKQLSDDFRTAQAELEKATGVGAYIISTEAAKVLSDHTVAMAQSDAKFDYDHGDPLFEKYAADSKLYKGTLEKLRTLAKTDLGVK